MTALTDTSSVKTEQVMAWLRRVETEKNENVIWHNPKENKEFDALRSYNQMVKPIKMKKKWKKGKTIRKQSNTPKNTSIHSVQYKERCAEDAASWITFKQSPEAVKSKEGQVHKIELSKEADIHISMVHIISFIFSSVCSVIIAKFEKLAVV